MTEVGFPRTGATMAFCLHKSGILHGNNILNEITIFSVLTDFEDS